MSAGACLRPPPARGFLRRDMSVTARSVLLTVAVLLATTALPAQQAREGVRLDDPGASRSPDSLDLVLAGQGTLRIALWLDERGPNPVDDDLLAAVSTDAGVHWGPELALTDTAVTGWDVDNPAAAEGGGILHVVFDDDRFSSLSPAVVYLRSADQGASWQETVLATGAWMPRIAADGDRVAVVWQDLAASVHHLFLSWSRDGGATWEPPVAVEPGALGNVPSRSWTVQVRGDTIHVLYVDDRNGTRDLFYTWSTDGAPCAPATRVDQDPTFLGEVEIEPVLAVDGLTAHVAWLERGRDPLNPWARQVYYAQTGPAGAASSGEQALSPGAPVDAWPLSLAASGGNVLVAWVDDRSGTGGDRPVRVRVSWDSGASFEAETTIPAGGPFPADTLNLRAFAAGSRLFLAYVDDSWTPVSADRQPTLAWSPDAGATWRGPFLLASGLGALEGTDVTRNSWAWGRDSLSALWRSEDGFAGQPGIVAGGIRFPFTTWTQLASGSILTLDGADPALAARGAVARWAASKVLGGVTHPENPGLHLDLAPSGAYTRSLAAAASLTAPLQADGSASLFVPAPPPPQPGRSGWIQGWVNDGGLGMAPGDPVPAVVQ